MGTSRAIAHHARPCVTMTQARRMTAARRGVLLPEPEVDDGTQGATLPVTASATASRCAVAYTSDSRSISSRHPGTMSGSRARPNMAGRIGR